MRLEGDDELREPTSVRQSFAAFADFADWHLRRIQQRSSPRKRLRFTSPQVWPALQSRSASWILPCTVDTIARRHSIFFCCSSLFSLLLRSLVFSHILSPSARHDASTR